MAFDLTLTDLEWYFAEGYTGPGFEEFLCVLNPNDTDVEIKVTYYLENLEDNFSKVYSIPAHQRFTLSVNGEVPDRNVSLRVASSGRVICERPMYFNYRGAWTGGHDVIGANAPSNEWYFAEGTTRAGFDEWLCIMNPDVNIDAKVTVTYMTATGETTELEYAVPPGSRYTIDVNQELGPDQDVSIKVVSSGPPVVAERPMYFAYGGAWTGGHITMGATKPESHWYFAEGTTRAGFDEWLCIGNPGAEATVASVTYFIAGESPVTRDYNVAAHSRYTVKVNDAIGPEKDVSISVVSDRPTVVERPMYFNYGGAWTGGHDVIGSNRITEGWFFAEGTNQDGFQEWLCLLNPNDAETDVQVTYILGTGELVNRTYTVGASQRYTVFVNNEVAAGRRHLHDRHLRPAHPGGAAHVLRLQGLDRRPRRHRVQSPCSRRIVFEERGGDSPLFSFPVVVECGGRYPRLGSRKRRLHPRGWAGGGAPSRPASKHSSAWSAKASSILSPAWGEAARGSPM